MKTVIRAFPSGVNIPKEGNGSRNSVKWSPAEIGNAAGRSVVESLQEQARNYAMNPVLRGMGGRLATYLAQPIRGGQTATASLEQLGAALKPGDVLLVEGSTRVSVAIKYLTQSTWSQAMFYIGDALEPPALGESPRVLVEADMLYGIRAVPLSDVSGMNTRIRRPVGLSKEDLQAVIRFTVSHIGGRYDLKNGFDLARYLVPTPPVPGRWRRPMIAFRRGGPTPANFPTPVAQGFHAGHYPNPPPLKEVP